MFVFKVDVLDQTYQNNSNNNNNDHNVDNNDDNNSNGFFFKYIQSITLFFILKSVCLRTVCLILCYCVMFCEI